MMRQTPRGVRVVVLAASAAGLCSCDVWNGRPQVPASPAASAVPSGTAIAELGLIPREAVVPTAVPRASGRNPFTMTSSMAAAAPMPAATPTAPPLEDITDLPPSVPLLTLIGIAERRDASGLRRTAIVAGLGDVFLAAEGEAVSDRYVVRSIGESLVELTERETGQVMRLALKSSR